MCMWVPCTPVPQTLSSLHTAQTGPRHTGVYHEARLVRQAALSEAFPERAVCPERTECGVSCCLLECASVVTQIPGACRLASHQLGWDCLAKEVSERGLKGDSNHQGDGGGVRTLAGGGRGCWRAKRVLGGLAPDSSRGYLLLSQPQLSLVSIPRLGGHRVVGYTAGSRENLSDRGLLHSAGPRGLVGPLGARLGSGKAKPWWGQMFPF